MSGAARSWARPGGEVVGENRAALSILKVVVGPRSATARALRGEAGGGERREDGGTAARRGYWKASFVEAEVKFEEGDRWKAEM